MSRLVEQVEKFSVVGAIAFALDYLILMLLTFHLGMRPVDAAGISFVVVNLFTYFVEMRFVFTHRKGFSRTREILTFFGLLFVGMVINEIIVEVVVRLMGTTRVTVSVAKVLSSLCVTTWNFYSRRRWLDGGAKA